MNQSPREQNLVREVAECKTNLGFHALTAPSNIHMPRELVSTYSVDDDGVKLQVVGTDSIARVESLCTLLLLRTRERSTTIFQSAAACCDAAARMSRCYTTYNRSGELSGHHGWTMNHSPCYIAAILQNKASNLLCLDVCVARTNTTHDPVCEFPESTDTWGRPVLYEYLNRQIMQWSSSWHAYHNFT